MIKNMGMVHFIGLMVGSILANGKTGSKMEKVPILGVIKYQEKEYGQKEEGLNG
jgi:hypothetical protein